MGLLHALFTAELLVGVVFSVCVLFAGRSLVHLIVQGRSLRARLRQLEAELQALVAGLPDKRDRVAALQRDLRPLQVAFRELDVYCAELRSLEERAARQEAEEERVGDEDPIRQRRRGPEDIL